MTIEKLTSDLAQAMAYKACEKKDIQTTAEGRSALKYHYDRAKLMIENTIRDYLDKLS